MSACEATEIKAKFTLSSQRKNCSYQLLFTVIPRIDFLISQWVMAGGDLYLLKEILSHKSVIVTERYSHLSAELTKSAINVLNKMYPSSLQKPEIVPKVISNQPAVTPASQGQPGAEDQICKSLQGRGFLTTSDVTPAVD